MRIFIQHRTEYIYDQPALFGPHIVRLRPAAHARAALLSYNLDISPECEARWQHDPWGNRIVRLTFPEGAKSRSMSLTVDASFDIQPVNPFDFFIDDRCEMLPFRYPDGLAGELAPFLELPDPTPKLAAFVETVPAKGKTIDYLVALNRAVAARVDYIIREEAGIQTSEQTLTRGRGSCRDSAVLLVDVLRSRGLAARFVSGYLVQLMDEGIVPDLPRGMDRDVVDLHAWAEVYVPGAGWIGLDGTSGLLCGEGHIPLASTVSPELAAPVTGTASAPASEVEFEMKVARVGHEPRPRKPYTDEQWRDLCAAGDAIDASLRDRGIELTCGGEPTFTSRIHPAEPEWITGAVGPTKWVQGLRLAEELRQRLPDGLLAMHQMGKLYPGESLPRWNLQLYWRTDDVPIWRDPELLDLAVDGAGGADGIDIGRARRFATALSERLEVADRWLAGYEDPWVSIVDEQNLPDDVDPLEAELDDHEDRRRLARLLARGLGEQVGLVLPLAREGAGWTTSSWSFRRGQLFLIPGDSPMGLRLPLDRIGGRPPERYDRDVTALREPLLYDPRTGAAPPEAPALADGEVPRTALCVEPRDGALNVFLPPVDAAEDFLALVAAIEKTAADLAMPVRVEGYGPPSDPRIQKCVVAPDPGVIEVNLPVADSFADYVGMMELVTDAANHADLCTEKYQLDGREVGSGGGNHLTLGGATCAESPFLNRPELLAGLVRYLQNHPSLSYLFTGLFVGPTSQAPRIDEARHDALYEMELALDQLSRLEPAFPWQVDRALRNLLVDVAGNTHRTEVCIDKLYDPHNLAGRQGIIELRAFEMPPHERMAAAQMLLARALVARFAAAPYDAPLVRWGSRLHDQFMLPHYIWADFCDVVEDLRATGVPLEADWYLPFLDHRCPHVGRRQIGDVSIELRLALEPWPTLGEQPAGPVVARYVDASLERLQVKVAGMTPGRHRLAVNGVALPTRPTGTAGEEVAGVRFRAWQPPECLHPTIGMHHPLRFDLIDTWSQRALGACSYHVIHPDGAGYNDPPLTAFEAAARRAQRFTTDGHAPWPAPLREVEPHPEQPYTLDLRRL